MILELDNVELNFKEKQILCGIYIKAESNNILGILGRNGSGKSCLMRIIFGDLNPKYKLLRLDNKPILRPLFETGLVSYLPQHHLVPSQMKVRTAFKLFKVDWGVFISDFKGLEYAYNKRIGRLSGGERRLIDTYLILKKEGKILLLDEPFSHLAPIYVEQLKSLLLKEKQYKVVIVTDHLYKEITTISDTLYLMTNGSTQPITDLNQLKDYNYLRQD